MALPSVTDGEVYEDSRGSLRFCNDFDMVSVKRFYTISNSPEQPVRGWIGHKRETKWFFPLKGTTAIAIEPMGDFNAEAQRREEAEKFVLKAEEPKVLKVPSGNWFCIEQHDGAEVIVFSDCKVGEYDDDYRRPM